MRSIYQSELKGKKKFFPDKREKVELFISCENLKSSDLLQASLPFVVLYIERDGVYELSAETEIQKKDVLNPSFTKTFIIDYFFAVKQNLKFSIKTCTADNKDKVIGEIYTTLGELMIAKELVHSFPIISSKTKSQEILGKLLIRIDRTAYTSNIARMTIKGVNLRLPRNIFFKKTYNLSFRLYRLLEDETYGLVFESEIRKSESPRWNEIEIGIQKLCNGDYDKQIKLQMINNNTSNSSFSVIGETHFSIAELMVDKELDYEADLVSSKDQQTRGKVIISYFDLVENPHFLDYIRSGLQFKLLLGIDYTSSNGNPSKPDSLHSTCCHGPNEYQRAIKAVFDILLNYNDDKQVYMLGFGGIPNFATCKSALTNHCFPLTGNYLNPFATGLDGIMEVYLNSLKNVQLASPSYLEPIIKQAQKIARESIEKGNNDYVVLLILTDGKCHDMQDTINAIIASSRLPLSIIIIGLGDGDFRKMEILDGDRGLLNDNGRQAHRDLVQFVPFQKFENNADLLAKYVLEEVPNQVVQYMVDNQFFPLFQSPRRFKSDSSPGSRNSGLLENIDDDDDDEFCSEEKNKSLQAFKSQQGEIDSALLKTFHVMKERNSVKPDNKCNYTESDQPTFSLGKNSDYESNFTTKLENTLSYK